MNGNQTIYIGEKTLRVDNERQGISYIAGTGTLTVMNTIKKAYCTLPIENYHNRLMEIMQSGGNDDIPNKKFASYKKTIDPVLGHVEYYRADGIYQGAVDRGNSGYIAVPLSQTTKYGPQDHPRVYLITKYLKSGRISAAIWSAPQSYRRLKSINEVVSGDSELLNEFIRH